MNTEKTDDDKLKANDGTTLDIAVGDDEVLPTGLERMRTGVIAVTKLYCPNGHNLIDEESGARFNGFPGISLTVEGSEISGNVVVSPIHGDDTRFGETDYEPGEITRVTCPECGTEFPVLQPCGCQDGANLVGLFLDKDLNDGNQVAICTAWGCLRSRITDRFQVISRFE
ncbi:MAG: hypothetical protein JRF63_12870 [Deltaproteobacteria bacterium]|nr:hypothetical protein [Deltaproteobacteria bacterium]